MSTSATHNEIMEAGGKDRRPTETKLETYFSVNDNIKKRIDAKSEAVHIILTGIDNDIYLTVDACVNAKEMHLGNSHHRMVNHLSRTTIANFLSSIKTIYHPPTSTKRQQAATRSKGKEIARTPSPLLESKNEVISDEDDTPRDKGSSM
uniref:Uncharacterized protein n=1 Tax=Tanacetum cinerariifolium TaxID=118510 RepID=A0A699HUS0_TANCI|nr:hypothetical protein [Tanacetum cinerariifolium]